MRYNLLLDPNKDLKTDSKVLRRFFVFYETIVESDQISYCQTRLSRDAVYGDSKCRTVGEDLLAGMGFGSLGQKTYLDSIHQPNACGTYAC